MSPNGHPIEIAGYRPTGGGGFEIHSVYPNSNPAAGTIPWSAAPAWVAREPCRFLPTALEMDHSVDDRCRAAAMARREQGAYSPILDDHRTCSVAKMVQELERLRGRS
jgi:hypothetical protein